MRPNIPGRPVLAALALTAAASGQAPAPADPGWAVPGAIARAISPEFRALDAQRLRLEEELAALPATPSNERSARLGWKVFGYRDALPARQWVEIDLGSVQKIDAVVLVPADPPDNEGSELGSGFPLRFRVDLEQPDGARAPLANFTAADFPNPGMLPVFLPAHGAEARRVRITLTKPWQRRLYRAYAFGEILVLSGNRNLATGLRGVTVRTSDSHESPPAWGRANLVDGQSAVGAPMVKSDRPLASGWKSADFPTAHAAAWVQVDLGASQTFDEVRLTPARMPVYAETHGFGFPRRLRLEASDSPRFESPRLLADWSSLALGDPSFSPVTIPGDGRPARYVRVTPVELWQRTASTYTFALAELQVYRGDANLALGTPVTAADSPAATSANFKPEHLTDGLRGISQFTEWPDWLGQLSRRRELLREFEACNRQLAALQPALARATLRALVAAALLLAAGMALALYRARRARARAVAALQRQIAGDLHDEVGSNLASIALLTELSQRQGAGLAGEDLDEVRRLASESASAMRDLVWLIQPGPHDAARLADRLRSAARRLLANHDWRFEIDGLDTAPALDVQRHLLLSLKEMLHNVVRHAGARSVEIRLTAGDGRFTLEVRDDGCGFDAAAEADGHGFASLRHRAALMRGDLALESQPGRGARIALRGCLRSPGPAAAAPAT